MVDALRRDYGNTAAMIFGVAPAFDKILASIEKLDIVVNRR
jgi:hypothetical protein